MPGRYRLRRLLRRGGMGTVWLANDRRLRRPVAVKQLVLTSVAADEERLRLDAADAFPVTDHTHRCNCAESRAVNGTAAANQVRCAPGMEEARS